MPELYDDALKGIFYFSPIQTVCRLAQVNKHYNQLAKTNGAWERRLYQDFGQVFLDDLTSHLRLILFPERNLDLALKSLTGKMSEEIAKKFYQYYYQCQKINQKSYLSRRNFFGFVQGYIKKTTMTSWYNDKNYCKKEELLLAIKELAKFYPMDEYLAKSEIPECMDIKLSKLDYRI